MKQFSPWKNLWFALVTMLFSGVMFAQTNPVPFSLASGNYSFTGFEAGDITDYPASMQGHIFSNDPGPDFVGQPTDDALLSTSSAPVTSGTIRNEIENGISVNASNPASHGAFVIALNTEARGNITLSWVAEDLTSAANTSGNPRNSGLRLQYRIGDSGDFIEVDNTTYLTSVLEKGPEQVFENIELPSEVNDQELVQVRFLYFQNSGTQGARQRIRLDEIDISSQSLTTFDIDFSLLAPENGTILDLNETEDGTTATISWEEVEEADDYTFQLALSGASLENPLLSQTVETNELSFDFSTLNDLLIANGIVPGAAASFKWNVLANLSNGQVEPSEETWYITIRAVANEIEGDPIVTWSNNNTEFTPESGEGVANTVGGVVLDPDNPNSGGAFRMIGFPEQFEASGTAGIEFYTSTEGQTDIMITFEHRASGTASRFADFQVTINGGDNWISVGNNYGGIFPRDEFYPFTLDLSNVEGVENNPDFGFRIVSIFGPMDHIDGIGGEFEANTAYERNRKSGGNAYDTGGNWRVNDIIIYGTEQEFISFNLLSPENDANVNLNDEESDFEVTITWEEVTQAESYVFLLDFEGGDFSTAFEFPVTENELTLTYGAIDQLLADADLIANETANLIWTVKAIIEDAEDVFAEEAFNINITRYSNFSLLTPADNEIIDLGMGEPSDVAAITWEPVADIVNYEFQITLPEDLNFEEALEVETAENNTSFTFAELDDLLELLNVGFFESQDFIWRVVANLEDETQVISDEVFNITIIRGDALPEAIAFWSFDGDVLEPEIGEGTFAGLNLNNAVNFFSGNGSPSAANLSGFAPQGTESGERGANIQVSTANYTDISISFDLRATNTASRWFEVRYTIDGENWLVLDNNEGSLVPPTTFISYSFDFSDVEGVANNPEFAFRIVSIFSPEAFGENAANTAYQISAETGNYNVNGAWRIDNLLVQGVNLNLPSFALLTPENGEELDLNSGEPETEAEITWEAAEGAVAYTWVAYAGNGNFDNPDLSIEAADTPELTLSFEVLDNALAALNVPTGGSATITWSVIAELDNGFSVMADEAFTLTLTRFGELQTSFNLLTPENGAEVNLNDFEEADEITITWEAFEGAISYEWLVDLPGGLFTNPAVAIGDLTEPQLVLTAAILDETLADLGLIGGEDIDLIWTVRATLADETTIFAEEPFAINITRYDLFSLISPADETLVDLGSADASTEVVISWEPLANVESYVFELDGLGGVFAEPVQIPVAEGTELTLTYGAIDDVLASLGVDFDEQFDGIWRIVAVRDAAEDISIVSQETFAISFIRPTQLPEAIAFWSFEGDVLTPAIGVGTFNRLGLTGSLQFFAGNGSPAAVNLSGFAPQGTESGQRGAQVNVATTGYTDVVVSFDIRATATASRWFEFQYTIDGVEWITVGNNNGDLAPNNNFVSYEFDLSEVEGVANNPNFAFRAVSIFSPLAFGENAANTAYQGAGDNNNYATGGAWRMDNVLIEGLRFFTFDLLTPVSGTTVDLDSEDAGAALTATWEDFTGAVSYTWVADTIGGSFANPIHTVPGLTAPTLTLPYTAVDELLASLDFGPGSTVALDWSVAAQVADSDELFYANEQFTLFLIRIPVGIAEISGGDFLKVFPNPTSGIINLEATTLNTIRSIDIIDASGRVVEQRQINRPITGAEMFDISNQAKGIYFIRLVFDNDIATLKVIKQ
jgi:hypothetical protein